MLLIVNNKPVLKIVARKKYHNLIPVIQNGYQVETIHKIQTYYKLGFRFHQRYLLYA